MNNNNNGKSGKYPVDPGSRAQPSRLRPWRAAPAVLALALGWPLGAAADCTSGEGCLTTALDGLIGGFTGAAGSDLWGWMLGGGQSAGADQISSELENIQNTLTTIENELGPNGPIVAELQSLNCAEDASWINAGPATTIGTLYTKYQGFLTDLQEGTKIPLGEPTTTNQDWTELYGWANAVIQGDANAGVTAVETAMNALYNDTTPAAGKGTIHDCVQAEETANPTPAGSLDDRPPYQTATNLQNYLLNLNTQGMIMLTEAYHIYQYGQCITDNGGTVDQDGYVVDPPAACQSGSADDVVPNLCPNSSSSRFCTMPKTLYGSIGNSANSFTTYVHAEFKAAGAPLSTDSHLVVNGEGQMLVRSIEIYNAAAGVDCPDPQVQPDCGPTVGQWDFKGPLVSYPVGPYGFGGGDTAGTWAVANESLFGVLLDQGFNQTQTMPVDGTVTPGEFLCTMSMTPNPASCTQSNGGQGLENADKLLLFPQSLPEFSVGDGFFIGPFACFMDGYMGRAVGPQPFCTQFTFGNILATGLNDFGCYAYYAVVQAIASSHIPYYPGWYSAHICIYSGQEPDISLEPAYWPYKDTVPPAFWWPILPLDTITCQNGKSALDESNLNPAGLPQLCTDKDFNIWFQAIVPALTTTSAIADATLGAAAPNTNDGASAELKLAGGPHGGTEVALVGFDPAQLQAFLEAGPLDNAQLILTRVDTSVDGSGRGSKGKGKKDGKSLLVLRPLRSDFVEGDGDIAGPDRGTGGGTTWNCAEDADIANDAQDCLQYWVPGGWEAEWGTSHQGGDGEALQFVEAGEGGPVGWDVTEAVRRGVHAWALRVRGNDRLALVSREGAAALGNPGLAPTLILTHPVEQSVSLNE